MNKDTLNLPYWLRANKLCLIVQKSEPMIFRTASLKTDSPIKFKLQEKVLITTQSVTYLGLLLDEHFATVD